jgi:very-short-patch-repair endonuclease
MREEMRSHAKLAELAETQYGLVTRRQMVELGFSAAAIGRASGARRLHRVHRGVYALGHPVLGPHARCLAAVMTAGRGAILSHGSAAWLWGLEARCGTPVEVTVPSHGGRRHDIAMHHSSTLSLSESATMERIPVTALPRTLLDLAATVSPRKSWNAIDRAERLGLLDLAAVDGMLRRRRGHRGARRLRQALEIYRDPAFHRARSERLFSDLVKRAGLPKPAMNAWVESFEIDAYWARERFAVEVDGWDAHRTRRAFERDRLRQEEMKLAGIDCIRISARRIEREPRQVARRLSILLAQRRTALDRR